MKVQSMKKPTQQYQIKNLFNVSPAHVVHLEQLLKICPTEYRARISELRRKGMDIQCIDKQKGIYRYYAPEVSARAVASL